MIILKNSLTTGGSLRGLNLPLGDEGGVNVYFLVFYIDGRDI